ncbi:RAD2 [Candida pseudojiufengensis]|uniref:RAD2 n=1 Tax=Candida pseudojiufengensis TaxID=497109 RepID=UPI00222459A4|nr:RAD2 [Candida pseudojiufengensis]KAI5965622.1 RAD2 [Candida pseudojiufengensis]
MGVQSLWDIVGPSARPVRLEALSRKKLAVDASIWIYQFLKAVRDKEGNALHASHIVGFFRRICKLLYYGILPIFVFDGGVPALKRQTINERKSRRQEKSESTRETAQKLLAIQLQREAEGSIAPRVQKKSKSKTPDNDDYDDDVIYFEDLPGNQKVHVEKEESSKPKKSVKFRKKDEYHLPDLHEFKVSRHDQRIMPDDEIIDSLDDFDHVDGININDVDPKSKEFSRLPIATQYMILNHLRLKSRLRMGYRKEQLEELFPNSMDFSKFQIQQVQKRNFYTQKLMNVTGMGEDVNVEKRIAGDKDRKYALVKNDDGWTLALQGGETSIENPIHVFSDDELKEKVDNLKRDQHTQPITVNDASEDSDDEFEDVPLQEQQESEADKEVQAAIIKSIYDQYDTKPTIQEDEENDLRKAVDESKEEYYKMMEEEKQFENKVSSIDFSSSLLFSNPKTANSNPKDQIDFTSSSLFAQPTQTNQIPKAVALPEAKNAKKSPEKSKVTTRTPQKEVSSKNELKNSFMFQPEEYQTGKIEITKGKDEKREEFVNEPKKYEPEDSDLDSSDDSIFIAEKSKTKSKEKSKKAKKDMYKLPTIPKKPAKAGQQNPLPSWFQDEVKRTLNPHNEKFVADDGITKEGKKNEEEDAGLISWYEAKQYLDKDNDNRVDDDEVQEVNPNFDAGPTLSHENNVVHDDEEQEKSANKRRPAVIDYDFEEEDEDNLIKQLQNEEFDHESLRTQIVSSQNVPISSIETRITDEQLLQEKLAKAKRDSDEVTENMIHDVQELLKRFGIPFITAPMEAEAQCAELLKIGLVDGIITDDSDCFLFGGDKIYKNMFNQKQFVECYFKDDVEQKIGLSQVNLIELALLLGSDYTEGIKGIGPVLAMEILAEFGSLKNFKKWFDLHTKSNKDKKELNSLEKNLLAKVKNGKLYLPDGFPDKVVFEAYELPQVDSDRSEFKWGVPNLDQIRSFLMFNVGWTQERVDEIMIPLIRDLNKKKAEGTQSTIGEFFPQEYIQSRKELTLGKRMKTAANKLNKRRKV